MTMSTDLVLLGLILGLVAGLANLLGGLVVVSAKRWDPHFLKYFIAFGSGFLLAAVFLKMIPISLEHTVLAPVFILLGYFLIHFFEHTAAPHFHFGEETHLEELSLNKTVGLSALLGLTVHAFFDGVSIASGLLVSSSLGFLIFTAIILHKLPEGFTIASITLAAGGSKRRALFSALILATATILGTILMQTFQLWFGYALALSAGASLYVAASDLIPEVNREKGIWMSIMVFVGVGLFYITEYLVEKLGF